MIRLFFAQPSIPRNPAQWRSLCGFQELEGCFRPRCLFRVQVREGTTTISMREKPTTQAIAFPGTKRGLPRRASTMSRSNDKQRIIEHYDLVSPFYRSLWGEHLHHGYWIRGNESKEKAQLQLIEHLAQLANVRPGSDILDIGCGFGASALFLAEKFNATVTGITISPAQVEIAKQAATERHLDTTFLLMDAEAMRFDRQFDFLWSVESISHYQDRPGFFASTAKLLKPNGTFALTDWFKKDHLTPAQTREFIEPIETGMFVELQTMDDYAQFLASNG